MKLSGLLAKKINNWITQTDFKDPDKNLSAFYVQAVSLIITAASLVIGVVYAIAGRFDYVVVTIVNVLAFSSVVMLVRLKKIRFAANTLTVLMLGLLILGISSAGGINSLSSIMYPVILIFASLFLSRKQFILYTLLCVFSIGSIVYAENQNLLPPYVPDPPEFPVFITFSLMVAGSALAIRFITESLQNNLSRVRQAMREVSTQKAMLDHVGQAVVGCDADSIIIYWNQAATDLYGWKADEVLGRKYYDVVITRMTPDMTEAIRVLLRDGEVWSGEFMVRKRDKSEIPVIGTITPLRDEYGQSTGWIGIAADLTSREKAEQESRRRADEMSLLYRLGVSLAAGHDLFSTLNALQVEISRLIRHDSFFVAIYDEKNDLVSFPIFFMNGEPAVEPSRYLKEKPGLTGPVIFGGKTLYLPDTMEDEIVSIYKPVGTDDMHTFLGVPLFLDRHVIGAISVQSIEIDAYTPGQIHLLENIAVHAALAIDKARLLDQLQQQLLELQRAEHALSFSEEKFFNAFHITPVLMSIEDSQNRFIDVNNAFVEKIGYEREQVIGRQASDLNMWGSPEDINRFRRAIQEKGFFKDLEMHFRNRSGDVGVVLISSEKFNVNNEVYSLTSAVDITEQKRVEAGLRYRESILGAITSAAELFIKSPDWRMEITAVLEKLGKTISASHAYLFENHLAPGGKEVTSIMFEWAAESIQNDLNDVAFKNIPLKESDMERWYETLLRGRPFISDKNMVDVSEKEFLKNRGIKALLDMPIIVNGKWWGVMGFDDTQNEREWSGMEVDVLTIAANVLGATIERQNANAALTTELGHRKKLIEELEIKNSELERFTYTVSHDLRSPLVTIKGFLGYLDRDALSGNMENFHKDMNRISSAADKMDVLLKDLLELSRIGRITNKPVEVPFDQLAREAAEIVNGQLEKRGVALQINPDLPVVYGDKERLVEVLQNLIDNATKYMGAEKHPQIEIGHSGEEDGSPVFYVRDNGMGISPEYHENIFGLFNKLDPKAEGTGIGLALVKRIIEVHKGRIWVESEVGKGSTFYFVLGKSEGT